MNIAGRPANTNRTAHLDKMVHKTSKTLDMLSLANHTGVPFLFVGSKPANVIKTKKTTTNVKVPSFSGDVSTELIEQYGSPNSRESGDNTFPQIKCTRGAGEKAHNSREKCTSLSLERVESQGKTIFTEGLSSISRRDEPLLVFHRRDIHGANMPDTVKVARERSKVVFGVRNCVIQRSVPNKGRSVGHKKSDVVVTVDKATDGDATERDKSISTTESDPSRQSPIAQIIKQMEHKYGVSPSLSPHPLTPIIVPICANTCMSNHNTPKNTPRPTPKRTLKELVKKGPVNVVSLFPDFKGKEFRSPRLHVPQADEIYIKREAFRQHEHEKRLNLMQIPADVNITEERIALRVSMYEAKKGKQNNLFKRCLLESSMAHVPFIKGIPGDGILSTDRDFSYAKKTDGSFHVRGVVGTSVVPRSGIWIPESLCEEDTLFLNPPPTAEDAYDADLSFNNMLDPLHMSPVEEDAKSANLGVFGLPHKSGDLSTFERRELETRDSSHSGKSSNLLLVPAVDTKTERRPSVDLSSFGDNEDGVRVADVAIARTISTQTSPHRNAGSEVKASIQTLELSLPCFSDSLFINTSDKSSSPEVIKNAKRFEPVFDAPELDYVKDYASGSKSQQLFHNKAIRFTSPFEIEERQ